MSRSCPVCDKQPLKPIMARDVEIDLCPRCEGLWFDPGELELFPDRPKTKIFLADARLAPGRCRRSGHRVPKGTARCPSCGSDTARCPACGSGLSMVAAQACVIDVCTACQGVWLDKGELELLEGVTKSGKALPTPAAGTWEIPTAAPPATVDPWRSPGSSRALVENDSQVVSSTFSCRHCAAPLTAYSAYAFDGDLYCAECGPVGAVGGKDLPKDLSWERVSEYVLSLGEERDLGLDMHARVGDVAASLVKLIGRLLR